MKDKQSKKITLTIISIALVLIMVVGVTYAFFNYTRTGLANTISVGRIAFNSSQDGRINLTNIFPIDPEETGIMDDTTKVGTIAITVTGDTSYDNGVEYLVSAVNVTNTVGTKTIPISISAEASGALGTVDEDYFENRDTATSHIYKVLAKNTISNISNNDQLMVGYIAKGATGINGTITIKAYIDKNKIAISDTYDGTENDNMGTAMNWVNGRTVFTTEEWNSMQGTGISFQVKVEANEGVWVEEKETINALHWWGTINSMKTSIKEIYFVKMGASRMQSAYESAEIKEDLTLDNEGKVLAWLEPDITDNTKYIMYVASDGKTYFPNGCAGVFDGWNNVERIEFNNIDTSRVRQMSGMFYGCANLQEIDLSTFNIKNISTVQGMFSGCLNLTTIYVSNSWNLDNVTLGNSGGMFNGCTSLKGGGTPQTVYDSNHVDKEYARIDGGANSATPGYLTLKTN